VLLTEAARRALLRQLSDLREEQRREIPARLRIAREFGDTANSDEYLAIREEEAVLAARIARFEDILARATVVEPADGDELVAAGSEVVVVITTPPSKATTCSIACLPQPGRPISRRTRR
jgi:transcription elongation GreA/GreB family factor